VSAEAII